MKRQRSRGYRRYLRERAIAHAFNIYWHAWCKSDRAFKEPFTDDEGFLFTWSTADYVNDSYNFLTCEESRRAHEDRYRLFVRAIASLHADHMRLCSCYMCSGWKLYNPDRKRLRWTAADKDDAMDF